MEDLPDSNTMFTKSPAQSCSFYICSVKRTSSKGFCVDSIRYVKNQGQCLVHSRGSVGLATFPSTGDIKSCNGNRIPCDLISSSTVPNFCAYNTALSDLSEKELHSFSPLKFQTFYFLLGYSRLTMLWQFQVNSEGTKPYIYISFLPQSPLLRYLLSL